MKKTLTTFGALALTTAAAQAGGIDRSGQPISAIFEKGSYAELSYGRVTPDVSGNDVALFGGGASGDVGKDYNQWSLSYKQDINEKLSFAVIMDQPFGADLVYGSGSVALGGTTTISETTAVTGVLRYKINEGFSVHGGLRAQQADGTITLRGAAYGGLNGYSVALGSNTAYGYLIGVAFEKPEIALRVALTYNSKMTHDFDTVETIGPITVGTSVTKVNTPQSVNLDFQSGVAKDTLVFGQIRWVDWSDFQIDPAFFTPSAGGGLVDLDNTVTYSIGVGRRLNENWAGSVSLSYEAKGDPLVTPLAPTNGRVGVSVGAQYTKDNLKVSMGVNYTKFGDAQPETGTPDTARANFTDNSAVGVGLRIGYSF